MRPYCPGGWISPISLIVQLETPVLAQRGKLVENKTILALLFGGFDEDSIDLPGISRYVLEFQTCPEIYP
jgi:hypothetical protein